MSLGIKSSAFLRIEHPFSQKSGVSSSSGYVGQKLFQEFGPIFFDMSSASGYMGETYFQEFGPRFFDMSSASGYMGGKYFQEFGLKILTCPQLVGTWVKIFSGIWSQFLWVKNSINSFGNLVPIFYE